MSIRVAVAIASILVASFATPYTANAGKVKSPLFAWVDSEGHLKSGKGAINTFRFSTGDYYVDFQGDLTLCAFSGTTSDGYAATVGVFNEQPGLPFSRVRVFVVAGVGLMQRWDYLLFGPNLKRDVVNLGPIPPQIDLQLFTQNKIDYLILDAQETEVMNSVAPLWPVVHNDRAEWYLVKRSEAELFSKPNQTPGIYEQVYGDDYLAYVRLKARLDQSLKPVRILTTDPRMAYYDLDKRFVFDLPRSLGKLRNFTHVIVSPGWSAEDYKRLGLSLEEVQQFLAREQFVKKIYEINGYTLYQIRG